METTQVAAILTPVEVAEELALLKEEHAAVGQRFGFSFALKVKRSELAKERAPFNKDVLSTKAELAKVETAISEKVGEWFSSGADTREAIKVLQEQTKGFSSKIETIRAESRAKTAELQAKATELARAVKYMDTLVLPQAHQRVYGQPIVPIFTVGEAILKSITKPAK